MGHLLKTLVAFLVLSLLEQDAEGAPVKGRYMWVRCRPDGRNANCAKEWGPWISLLRSRDRLPPTVKDIIKASLDLDLQSSDGSGARGLFVDWGSGDQSSSDWGSGEQSSDWGSGDQFYVDWQDLGLFTAEGRVQLVEGSGLEGSSFEGSASEGSSFEGSASEGSNFEGSASEGSSFEGSASGGSSSEGSGSVLDYTDFVFPESTVQQSNVPHTLELQEDNFNV